MSDSQKKYMTTYNDQLEMQQGARDNSNNGMRLYIYIYIYMNQRYYILLIGDYYQVSSNNDDLYKRVQRTLNNQ